MLPMPVIFALITCYADGVFIQIVQINHIPRHDVCEICLHQGIFQRLIFRCNEIEWFVSCFILNLCICSGIDEELNCPVSLYEERNVS